MIDPALAMQVLIWLAVLGVFLASGQASIFHPATLYLGFHGMVFVVRPLLVHYLQFDSVWNYMIFQPDETDFIRTLAVSSVALLCFVGGCLFFGWSQPGFAPALSPTLSPLQFRALLWTTVILLPYIGASIATTQGGAAEAGERAANGVFIQTHSTGWLNDAQFMLAPLLCVWLIVTRFHWLNLPPVMLYVAYRSWTGWSRWTIVLFFLMVTFAYCWQQRRKWLPLWSILFAIPLLILFNLLGHNRDLLKDYFTGQQSYEQKHDLRPGMSEEEKRNLRLDTQDFANFDYLCYLVGVVPKRTGGFTYGTQYLQLFTEPIPRILWRGKPVGSPVHTINITAYGNFVGLTVSLPGDGWLSGGWIGLVITLSLAGTVLGKAHRWFWRQSEKPMAALFYVSGLAMIPQWYRDGGISIYKFLLWTWLPFLVWLGLIWFLGHRSVRGHSLIVRPGERLQIIRHPRTMPANDLGKPA